VALAGAAQGKKHKAQPGKVLIAKPGKPSLAIESVDLDAARATLLVGGAKRAPEARLFTMRDDRERRFIALDVHCEKAADRQEPLLRCVLSLPRGYLAARVLGLTLELRGREVAAPEAEVAAQFARPEAPPSDGPPLDTAHPRPDAGR
jgi:hypothetical protein